MDYRQMDKMIKQEEFIGNWLPSFLAPAGRSLGIPPANSPPSPGAAPPFVIAPPRPPDDPPPPPGGPDDDDGFTASKSQSKENAHKEV